MAASVETPLSRYLNLPEPVRKLVCPEKINLLVVIPQNSGLDTTAERQALEEISARLGGKISVDFLEGLATSAAIRAALRKKDYYIFHYAGHGSFENEEAFIHLDHAEKLTEAMPATQFAHFFTDYVFTRLVFLNACQGATRSSHQALVGAAPQLVLRGVPAVIAMQYEIGNDDAILFATEFYEELCREREGGQVEVAVSRARKALLQERPASSAFGNPVLYLRSDDGRLWEEQKSTVVEPPADVKVKEQKPLLERWGLWVTLIGGILAIIVTLADLPEKISKLFVSNNKKSDSTQTQVELEWQTLSGQILDEKDEPLPEVVIILPEYDTTDTTNQLGRFEVKVKALHQARVSLKVMKEGYETINLDPSLGSQFNTIKMRRTK